jgi:excisionase family DNA binding protein
VIQQPHQVARRIHSIPQSAPDRFLSIAQAAALLNCHHQTIRGWLNSGLLNEYRVGRFIRVRMSEIITLLQNGAKQRTGKL